MTSVSAKGAVYRNARHLVQALVVIAALVFLWRFAARYHADLGRVPLRVSVAPLLVASVLWAITFGGLVLLWARSLRWWGASMHGMAALRVFFLANLARYVPGGVWQFAGLAAMSAAEGVPPLAATAAVLFQQSALLVTGATLALALAPIVLEPVLARLGVGVPSLGVRLTVVVVVVAALIALLPLVLPALRRAIEPRVRDVRAVPHVTASQLAVYIGCTFAGWIGYGVSFIIFAHAVLGAGAPPPVEGASIYVAAYVAGILTVIVPGGVGVREGVLVTALTPIIGIDRALFLAITSRLWLVALEILGALAFVRGPGQRDGGIGKSQAGAIDVTATGRR